MNRPDRVWQEATATLDGDTASGGIRADITGQPLEGSGYVYAQVGWLDEDGTTYDLRLPDNIDRHGTALRPLYICLGRHTTPPDAYIPGLRQAHPEDTEPCE